MPLSTIFQLYGGGGQLCRCRQDKRITQQS